jgi:hypothetical protein
VLAVVDNSLYILTTTMPILYRHGTQQTVKCGAKFKILKFPAKSGYYAIWADFCCIWFRARLDCTTMHLYFAYNEIVLTEKYPLRRIEQTFASPFPASSVIIAPFISITVQCTVFVTKVVPFYTNRVFIYHVFISIYCS